MRWPKVAFGLALALAVAAVSAVRRPPTETPARQDPEAATRLPGIATTGEPVQDHPWLAGEEPTPGSAAADAPAARESDGPVVGAGAGDYSRPPLGVLGPEPCNAPLPDGGRCVLRLGHPVGPWLPGDGGHLP
jgi:hypothetical protein